MKKIAVLLGIMAFSQISTMAYLNEGETSAIKTLEAQGYSRSTLEVVDWANYRNGGIHTKYVRYYQPKKNILGRLYQNTKVYLDPVQDNGEFGDTHIEFTNTWLGNDTFYSSDKRANKQVESL